jgi:hypothetical protein
MPSGLAGIEVPPMVTEATALIGQFGVTLRVSPRPSQTRE